MSRRVRVLRRWAAQEVEASIEKRPDGYWLSVRAGVPVLCGGLRDAKSQAHSVLGRRLTWLT